MSITFSCVNNLFMCDTTHLYMHIGSFIYVSCLLVMHAICIHGGVSVNVPFVYAYWLILM